jgi:2,3-bisphosphoglycerate-dependent phosphoglycerate mutase
VELVLIRHGLPQRIVGADGPADPSLDDRGQAQAAAVGNWLADEPINAIWSSPMRRARETAAPLAERLGLAVQFDDGLAEYDRESNEYVPVEELRAAKDPRYQALLSGVWEEGTDPHAFHATVLTAMTSIAARHPSQRVAVFCHGMVINAYARDVLGLPDIGGFFHPDYTSITRVLVAGTGQRSIRSLNETPHLRGTGLLG